MKKTLHEVTVKSQS